MDEKKSKLAKIKTTETKDSVIEFINKVSNEQKRKDSFLLLELMEKVSGKEAKMWGTSIIGFGNKRYKSPTSGREVDWFLFGFSPRKAYLSLYLMIDHKEHASEIQKLGKHKTAGGCFNINKMEDIDFEILKGLIAASQKQ
jgi:hypothetical protein